MKKLYVQNMTPPHTKTATCWDWGLVIRGTLTARAIAQKAITPSAKCQQGPNDGHTIQVETPRMAQLTHGRDDLRLDTQLALEPSREVRNAPLLVLRDVGNLPNVVEHVAAREQNDSDKRYRRPQVAVLDDGLNVAGRGGNEGHDAGDSDRGDHNAHPVDRPADRGVRAVRSVARKPVADLLGSLRARAGLVACSTGTKSSWQPYPLVKSYRTGSEVSAACGPAVGRK